MAVEPLSFDLVVATVDRVEPLDRLLRSIGDQSHDRIRVLVVDQNDDDRLAPVLARHAALELERLRAPRGLSRARNAALPHLAGDVVGWPDDDGFYADDTLERVARAFAASPTLAGVSGQLADPYGRPSGRWPQQAQELTPETVWNRAVSHSLFLRREALVAAGPFDETLGLGAGTRRESGEEIDLLVRVLQAGGRVRYEPDVVVLHETPPRPRELERALARRDGASVGYILARHRLGPRLVGRMAVRPLGGAALALARRDPATARTQLEVLRGRASGYRAGLSATAARAPSSSNSAA